MELKKSKKIPAKNCQLKNCIEQWQKIRYVANVYFSIVDNAIPPETDVERMSKLDLSKDSDFECYFYSPFIITTAVNMSFAVELGLKAILSKEKIQYKRIHKLDELYKLLPPEAKAKLFRFSKCVSKINRGVFINYCRERWTVSDDCLDRQFNDIEQVIIENLKEIQNINVELRYMFEKQNKEKIKTCIDKFFTFLEMYSDIRNYINFNLDDN